MTDHPWLAAEIARAHSFGYRDDFLRATYEYLKAKEDKGHVIVSAVLGLQRTQRSLSILYSNDQALDKIGSTKQWASDQIRERFAGHEVFIDVSRLDAFWNLVLSSYGGADLLRHTLGLCIGINLVRAPALETFAFETLQHEDWTEQTLGWLAEHRSAYQDAFDHLRAHADKVNVTDAFQYLRGPMTQSLAAVLFSVAQDLTVPHDGVRILQPDMHAGSGLQIANRICVGDIPRRMPPAEFMEALGAYDLLCRNMAASVGERTPAVRPPGWRDQWECAAKALSNSLHEPGRIEKLAALALP